MNILSFDEFVNEGLLMTYPIEKMVDYVRKKLSLTNDNIDIEIGNYGEKIIVDPELDDKTIDEITKILNMGGYFRDEDKDVIVFSKKFDEEATGKMGEEYLYHITPSINDKKIQEQGLVPKHKNKSYDYPERIFLLSDINLKWRSDFLYRFSEHLYYKSNKKNNEYSVYQISMEKLKHIRFFKASNAKDYVGYYTTENIRPEWLEKIDTIKL